MTDQAELKRYYARRAAEYEDVYRKPERQSDIDLLGERLRDLLAGHHVLEVACGTGYWTAVYAAVAASIVATDVNEEVLRLAREKQLPEDRVRFALADAYTLDGLEGGFSAGFAGFWLSHVLIEDRGRFRDALHARLQPGATVVMVDNLYVAGSNHPITRVDAAGNTYQQRRLRDGSSFEVLKNFPDQVELRAMPGDGACDVRYERLTYFWLLSYRLS